MGRGVFIIGLRLRLVVSEASHITHEVYLGKSEQGVHPLLILLFFEEFEFFLELGTVRKTDTSFNFFMNSSGSVPETSW